MHGLYIDMTSNVVKSKRKFSIHDSICKILGRVLPFLLWEYERKNNMLACLTSFFFSFSFRGIA